MMTAEQAAAEITRIINDDPTITDAQKVTITPLREGFIVKKEKIVLGGTVHSEIEKRKIEEVAKQYSGSRPVVNNIAVGH